MMLIAPQKMEDDLRSAAVQIWVIMGKLTKLLEDNHNVDLLLHVSSLVYSVHCTCRAPGLCCE